MHAVFLVPGIMGTELVLPDGDRTETVWPPSPFETQFGYHRTRKLADPRVVVGGIIRKVLCIDFYQPLFDMLDDLGFTAGGADKRLCAFPYDWRRDLFDVATDLGNAIAANAADATRITLVAHSMGGLICRLLLEDPRFRDQPWHGKIGQLIAIATPHQGAPLALARVLGRDSALGISGADFAWLANNIAYPAAYQLLPAPGEGACWDQSDPALRPIDIYDATGIAALGLNAALIKRVRAVHDILGAAQQPEHVRYFFFAAAGHRTATRVNVFRTADGTVDPGRTALTLTDNGGDGTVPLYSALPRPGQRAIVTNEHAAAFKGAAFRRVFVRLLGGNEGDALEKIDIGNPLALSVESPVVDTSRSVELLLYVDAPEDMATPIGQLSGTLVLVRVRDEDMAVEQEMRRIPLHYDGPALSRLRVYLDPVETPGHYVVRFESGEERVETAFSVSTPLPTLDVAPAEAETSA